jgi:DNA-binding NtrC family response regulator
MSKHLLVIDDEAPTRELLALMFRRQGLEVSVADTGRTGMLEVERQPFDLVVLDLDLGDADGIEMLPQIKKLRPGMPVIIFTGMKTNPALVESARQKGADGFMAKNQPLDQMLKEIRRLLGA